MKKRFLCISFFYLGFMVMLAMNTGAQELYVRAKIGVRLQSETQILHAKSTEWIRPGDIFKIYVLPEKYAFVYVVHTDGKSVNILSNSTREGQGSVLILPSMHASYSVDGSSATEQITIIVSPERLAELDRIDSPGMNFPAWCDIREKLIKKSRIDLSEEKDEQINIGGSVRGLDVDRDLDNDAFIKKLRTYSGKSIVVKHYEFKVKR